MLDEDNIERIDTSPWISNIVVALKHDKSVRVCVDLSAPNKAVIPERYPLPVMEELSSSLAGATIFSKLDLKWGYLQVPLAVESRDLTAFVCHEGVFRFKRLPFGLCSAPSAYQQIISSIIKPVTGAVNLLDDILVYGTTVAQHDARLRRVLSLLSKHNCTVNTKKCVLGQSQVEFNGHLISANGVLPLSNHVEAITKIPVPQSPAELKRFLATAAYLLKFVPSFATIVEPLRALLRNSTDRSPSKTSSSNSPTAENSGNANKSEWKWTPDCQKAFDTVKERISRPPVLAHFDVQCKTLLTCDASNVGLGACLSQIQE